MRTRAGRTLAEGYHHQGRVQGEWRYYDSLGNLQADFVCEPRDDRTLTSTWHYYGQTGDLERELTLPSAAAIPTPASQPTATASTLIAKWHKMAKSDQWLERVRAVRELRRLGTAAVPTLVSIVEQPDHPSRERALWSLQQMGPLAGSAAERLAKLAANDDDPLQLVYLQTLLAIDPARRAATVRQLMELCAVRQTLTAKDLYRSLDDRLGPDRSPHLADDLQPFVDDERPAVRQLATGLLLFQLAANTYENLNDIGWYQDSFRLGLRLIDAPQQRYDSLNEECEALIVQLTRLENDKDGQISSAVGAALRDYRAGKIRPVWRIPRATGSDEDFFDLLPDLN